MKLKQIVKSALKEDTGKGDITTNLIIRKVIEGKAVIKAKESGVLAGGNVAKEVFKLLDPKIKFAQLVKDRENFNPGAILFELKGSIAPILTGERTALNFLQKLSGIATLTHKFVEQVKGTGAKILDTRKTTPNLRELEKYSVRCGGGKNHRMGLWDMILIKDNHIKAAGGIDKAIAKCKMQNVKCKIEVEVKNLKEFKKAISYPVDRIMLDNMSITEIKKAVEMRNQLPKLEVSGGVNLDNVREIAKTGVDYISVGAITHSAKAIDMSLEILQIQTSTQIYTDDKDKHR